MLDALKKILDFVSNKAISSIFLVKAEVIMSNELNKIIILALWIMEYFKITVIFFVVVQMPRVIGIGSRKQCLIKSSGDQFDEQTRHL